MGHQVFTEQPAPARHRAFIDEHTLSSVLSSAGAFYVSPSDRQGIHDPAGVEIRPVPHRKSAVEAECKSGSDSQPQTPPAVTASEGRLPLKGWRSILGTRQLLAAWCPPGGSPRAHRKASHRAEGVGASLEDSGDPCNERLAAQSRWASVRWRRAGGASRQRA